MHIEKVKDFVVFGVKVKDTDFSFYMNSYDIFQWCDELWTVIRQNFSKDDLKDVKNLSEIFEPEFEAKRMARIDYLLMQERIENPVKVDGVKYKAIFIFEILWESWDCDSTAWVVETTEGNKVVFTNHGTAYFIDNEELQERIDNYKEMMESKSGDFRYEDYQSGIKDIEHAKSLL